MTRRWVVLFFTSLVSTIAYAIPFTVVTKAGTQLPTTVTPGVPTPAYYNVSNNTLSQRNNNFVKYLPPNTVQVTSGGTFPDTCGARFNLAPINQPGSSCTLQLNVVGAVNANDPDPHHHLFVCFPDTISCSGTNNPLNVSASPTPPGPVNNVVAYIINFLSSDISSCQINADGTLSNCTIAASGFNFPFNGRLNPANTFIYLPNSNGTVSYCPVNSDHSLGTCAFAGGSGFDDPGDLLFNSSGTIVYVANGGNNTVSFCTVNGDGTFSGCSTTGSGFDGPLGLAINAAGTRVYITNEDGGFISLCTVNPGGSLGACTQAVTGLDQPHSIAFNINGDRAYVANFGGTVSLCNVNGDGTLTCTDTGGPFGSPNDVVLNNPNTFAYVADFFSDLVFVCAVNSANGQLTGCTSTGTDFSFPAGIALL